MKFFSAVLFFSIFAISPSNIGAQNVPIPASPQTQPILISGATAHLGNGEVIENSLVAFENGKITFVGNIAAGQGFPEHKIIEASGKHLYPGFIAPNTTLGITEIAAVRATRDMREVGSFNPNVRSLIAYNTDSEVTPTVRAMGILLAQVTPQGGRISGESSIVELEGWNWEDAAYKTDDAIHLNWPNASSFNFFSRQVRKNKDYDKQIEEVKAFFQQALAYTKQANPKKKNLKFEAMRGLFDGSKKLFVHTNLAKSIQEAVQMTKEFDVTPVIVGGRDSWMVADFLKENEVPVILRKTQSLPRFRDDDVDLPFKTPRLLQEAGVLFCFSEEGNWAQRNLAFQAGQAVGFGLDYEDAIKGLTSNTAKILGIEKTVGTIETGKDATLFLCTGDVLDMRSSEVTQAFIRGKEINLDNKQKILHRRFQAKYESK